MSTRWTIDQVKEKLPDVKVKIAGNVYTGHVKGRKERFPTVYVDAFPAMDLKYSWQAITHSLNNETELLI